MKTIRTYSNPGEAGFFQSLLEASGVDATLDHEASAAAIPTGIVSARLQVPEDQFAEAERILAEHPMRFSRSDDRPKLGFWRSGLYGMLASGTILLLITLGGGSWHITGPAVLLVFIVSGLVGANIPTHRPPPNKRAFSETN